jgi:hypothetical protein
MIPALLGLFSACLSQNVAGKVNYPSGVQSLLSNDALFFLYTSDVESSLAECLTGAIPGN